MKNVFNITVCFLFLLISHGIRAENPEISQVYFEDAKQEFTVQDVMAFQDDRFIAIPEGHFLSRGFTDSAFWIKANIRGLVPQQSYILEVEFFPIDRIDFFDNSSGRMIVKKAGDSVPGSLRELKDRAHIFHYVPAHDAETIFFRMDTRSTVFFPLKIHRESDFRNQRFSEQFMMGMFFGIIFIMTIYNFLLFVNLRYRIYLSYVLFTTSIGFYLLIDYGYAKLFFWDDISYMSNLMNPIMGILTVIAGIFLTIRFLDLRRKFKILMRILHVLVFLYLPLLPAIFFIPFRYLLPVLNVLVIITVLLMIYVTIRAILRKSTMAYFFGIAFGGFFFIAGISSVANLGLREQNFISTYGFIVSTVFESTILSFALAYRINILRKQREYYKAESIDSKKYLNMLKNEVEIAAKIQNSILPEKLPVIAGLKVDAVYMPHGNIGGDLYDFMDISDNELGVLVADVTGHGIPAAMLASRVNFSFSFQTDMARDPAGVLASMNRSLYKKMARQFLTAVYTYINTGTKKMIYASAGHHPIIIWNRKTGRILCKKPQGRLMGIFRESNFQTLEFDLKSNDRILIYTDGLLESYDYTDSHDGLGSIVELLCETISMDIHQAKEFMINDLSRKGNIDDDVTFVLIDID